MHTHFSCVIIIRCAHVNIQLGIILFSCLLIILKSGSIMVGWRSFELRWRFEPMYWGSEREKWRSEPNRWSLERKK